MSRIKDLTLDISRIAFALGTLIGAMSRLSDEDWHHIYGKGFTATERRDLERLLKALAGAFYR